jgi:peptide/nickel transport system permease protein
MNLKSSFKNLLQYPSAIAGLFVIAILLAISVYAVVTIPYSEAIRLWRGGDEVWRAYPRNAQPAWVNYFSQVKKSNTIIMDSADPDHDVARSERETSSGKDITYVYTFDYDYDTFPQDLSLFFTASYVEKQPFVTITWLTPDGREIRVSDLSVRRAETYRLAQDSRLQRRLRGYPSVQQGLFADPNSDPPQPLKGTYELTVIATLFEPEGSVNALFVSYGEVYGIAGTDHRRRDLAVALLWGTPIALAFGLIGALGTNVATMIIAAFGVWFGGMVDATIQRITEVNLILPVLPILIMVATFQSRSIWLILGVIILLSIFGAGIKSYRAIFLQVKESPYIEAAQAYGTSGGRIVMRYMIPRIIPLIIPGLVIGIPAFVFLEAGLAVLGLGDPVLPTWGKVINDAQNQGALYNGFYYWVLEPAALLMFTGLGFSLLGFALDRVFNPRLRGV